MALTTIIEGMSQAQFLSALNANFALTVANYTTVTNLPTPDLQTLLNANFSKSDTYLGIKGSSFAGLINGNFLAHDISISKPTSLAVTWINDFARITFTDHSGGIAQHEIWESKNNGVYTLAYTVPTGVATYDYYTWQNASLNFKIRSKNGSSYSEFTSVVNIVTPLVYKTDQSSLNQTIIEYLWIDTGGIVNIDWGDGANHNYTGQNGSNITDTGPYVTHDYSTPQKPYFITLSGDLNKILALWIYQQPNSYGDLTKWCLPSVMGSMHFYINGFTGDITSWFIPAMTLLHVAYNNFSANLSVITWPPYMYDFHMGGLPNGYYGDFSSARATVSGNQVEFTIIDCNITGDLSNFLIPTNTQPINIILNDCHFTKLPRGNFRWCASLNAQNNNCNFAEIDDFLAYIDAYFAGGVVPLTNAIYTLNGTGMGIPSAAGLISRSSIIAKYVAVGKTCSILVNS